MTKNQDIENFASELKADLAICPIAKGTLIIEGTSDLGTYRVEAYFDRDRAVGGVKSFANGQETRNVEAPEMLLPLFALISEALPASSKAMDVADTYSQIKRALELIR